MSVQGRDNECEILRRMRDSPRLFDILRDQAGSEFQIQETVRREFPDEMVRAALSLLDCRRRAASKFSRSDEMWFDRVGLQQATMEIVARHKARRFIGPTWDLCCGIGGDTVALAEHVSVCAVDVNRAACLCTRWNAEVYGVSERVTVVCGKAEEVVRENGLVHIDPDRRSQNRRRAVRLEDYVPSVDYMRRVTREFAGGAIKIGPASNFAGQFPDTETELISVEGECKEATVWFGELATGAPRRATLLPSGASLSGDPMESLAELRPLGQYLYDPDPAVVRAGLLDLLAGTLQIDRLDESEEYLTSERLVQSPFVRTFQVLASLPNNERAIRRYVRGCDFGQVEIKSRHIRVQAEAIRRKLPLSGHRPGVLIFARLAGHSRAVVATRVDAERDA